MYTWYIESFKILARFCSWSGWFESDLVKNPRRHVLAWCSSIKGFLPLHHQTDGLNEPPHEKANKMTVRPAKTQISLGIRLVWSESSLSAWRKLGSLATHWAQSEDSDQTGQSDQSFRWAHSYIVGLVMRRLKCLLQFAQMIGLIMSKHDETPKRDMKMLIFLIISTVSSVTNLLIITR